MDRMDLTFLEELYRKIYDIFPKIVLSILFIILSWLIIKLVLYIVKKSLKLSRINQLGQKVNDILSLSPTLKIEPEKVILFFVKWFLILIFIIIGSDLLEMNLISREVSDIIEYLPRLFSGLVVFVLGLYGAAYLKKGLRSILKAMDINGSHGISQLLFITLSLMVSIMTLNHIGLETDIITNNLLLITGSILASFALAFGLGSKDIIYRLLLGYYSKRNFQIGQKILIDGNKGIIESIDNIAFVVAFEDKKIVYPIKYISNKNIEILT
jgi:hypothetical protein